MSWKTHLPNFANWVLPTIAKLSQFFSNSQMWQVARKWKAECGTVCSGMCGNICDLIISPLTVSRNATSARESRNLLIYSFDITICLFILFTNFDITICNLLIYSSKLWQFAYFLSQTLTSLPFHWQRPSQAWLIRVFQKKPHFRSFVNIRQIFGEKSR